MAGHISSYKDLLNAYEADISRSTSGTAETGSHPAPYVFDFPITPMTRALALAISSAIATFHDVPRIRALDVGTGSGIHAAIMSLMGLSRPMAIDISPVAVRLAEARWRRFKSEGLIDPDVSDPIFAVDDILEDSGILLHDFDTRIDLIGFNPPGYFLDRPVDRHSPVQSGLYLGPPIRPDDCQQSPVYKFFHNLVDPYLAADGIVVCTWPGLERRITHKTSNGGASSVLCHPYEFLRSWFGWTICSNDNDPLLFFEHVSPVPRYMDDGKEFLNLLTRYLDAGRYYSDLFNASDPECNFHMSFKFGVLALQRDSVNRNVFRPLAY